MNTVEIKLLPDGTGRVRIHWFNRDAQGPIQTQASTTMTALGPIILGGARGRIACKPGLKDLTPQYANGAYQPVVHSDDVRAVTCPECLATAELKDVEKQLSERLETTNPQVELQKMAQATKG